MYRGESWTIKKAEHQRIDHFKLWCWKRLFRDLGLQGDQTSQSDRKSTLNIHWKDWCWSWSSNTLATWCTELTHWKRPWCWERLKVKGERGSRGWDVDNITDSVGMNLSKHHWVNGHEFEQAPGGGWWRTGKLACYSPWGHKESDTTEPLNNNILQKYELSVDSCQVLRVLSKGKDIYKMYHLLRETTYST